MSRSSILIKKFSLFAIFVSRKITLFSQYHSNFANHLFVVGYTEKIFMQDNENFPHIYTISKEKEYDRMVCNRTYVP